MLLSYICFAGFLTLLGLAAITDIRERRIPNKLTGALAALYPVYVLVSPTPVAWLAALGLAAAVFVVGLGLFARELIGGGDVKLLAALSLWAGPEQFVWFMLVTTLAGGALSLISSSPRAGVLPSCPTRRRAAIPTIDQPPCPTASPSPPAASQSFSN
jgi:Flp pilus assembly protein protease CpaA